MRALAVLLAGVATWLALPRKVSASQKAQPRPQVQSPGVPAPALGVSATAQFHPVLGAEPVYPWETDSSVSVRAAPYLASFRAAERSYQLPPGLLSRVAYQESRFDADARSTAGALGLMQFMPATAQELRINPADPYQSIDGAARYLRTLFAKFGNWTETLAAYNWGPSNVVRKGIEHAPNETVNYARGITKDLGLS